METKIREAECFVSISKISSSSLLDVYHESSLVYFKYKYINYLLIKVYKKNHTFFISIFLIVLF